MAPVYMTMCALDRLDIRRNASQVAGNIDTNALKSIAEWGNGTRPHRSLATAHNATTNRISDIGKDAAIALETSRSPDLPCIFRVVVEAAVAIAAGLGGIAKGVYFVGWGSVDR
ncbi:hypothetical protein [Nocardia sp. CA-119907]|uniref:hypothetical protein n=1 Tax=Nocardia sp. CA-119907 TaxID=3239973 RepID=UPI003D99F88F